MKEFCMEHPIITFFLIWFLIDGIVEIVRAITNYKG